MLIPSPFDYNIPSRHSLLRSNITTGHFSDSNNTMFGQILFSFIALQTLACANPIVNTRDSSVAITSLEKSENSTSGLGNVAAAGHLMPFGEIGIGKFS
jgi:hypothetical protein